MTGAVAGATAALQSQINRDRLKLDDWVTCVSAKTPKGQAEIQKFSGEISAAREKEARIQASASNTPNAAGNPGTPGAPKTGSPGSLVDLWA